MYDVELPSKTFVVQVPEQLAKIEKMMLKDEK